MSLRIVPDSRVTIDALARELGVSQTPIRDALNRMEADGLVVRVPHAGYRIPPQITRDGSRTCSRSACCSSPQQPGEQPNVPQQSRSPGYGACSRRWRSWWRATDTWPTARSGSATPPSTISSPRRAGNQVVREALARLHTHVHLFRLLYDKQVTFLAMGEHDAVLAAVAARDPDAAAYAMRRHILLSGDRFRRLFDEVESADDPPRRA